MNEPYPFNCDWFKLLTSLEKCRWLIQDARDRPPLEALSITAAPALPPPTLPAIPHTFDEAQDPPTVAQVTSAVRNILHHAFKSNLNAEIHLPTFRAFYNGEKVLHSVFTLISAVHAEVFSVDLVETDVVMFDDTTQKRQFHYHNLHDALRWAFGSDNPIFPAGDLRDLLLMTKRTHGRAKLKFSEFLIMLETTQ